MPPGTKTKLKKEVERHRIIKFSFKDKICYYLYNQFGKLFVCSFFCWKNRKQITHVIDEAQDRLDAELNIVKMIQSLRNMKVLLKSSLMTEDVKFQIAHSQKNFINLDVTDSSTESDTGSDGNSQVE